MVWRMTAVKRIVYRFEKACLPLLPKATKACILFAWVVKYSYKLSKQGQ